MATENHNSRAHALLSASGASRWMACTPSARLEENFPAKSSSFAEEGTKAHELAELILQSGGALEDLEKAAEYSVEMFDQVQKHVDYVLEQFNEAKRLTPDAVLLIEKRVSFEHLIENGFGTCDVIIIADGTMEVIDLKYGMGVRVEAEDNPQLKLYALGALEEYELLYDIHNVRLTITQPRLDSISSWEISTEDLTQWGEDVVKPKAEIAYRGEGELVVGKHCQFCKAAPTCRAQLDFVLETVKEDFTEPKLITPAELVDIYKKLPLIENWFKAVSTYMFDEALNGTKWEGLKLVEGQSRRSWTDEDEVIKILKPGYDETYYLNKKVKGIGDIEKLVGKKMFPELFDKVVVFKKTSPSLVLETDKRPAMGLDQLKEDFA